MQYPEGRLQYELREGAPKHYKEMKMNQVVYAMAYLKMNEKQNELRKTNV